MGMNTTEASTETGIVEEGELPGRALSPRRPKRDRALPPELYPPPAQPRSAAPPPQIHGVSYLHTDKKEVTKKPYKDWRGLIKHTLDKLMIMMDRGGAVFCEELVKKFQNNPLFAAKLAMAFNAQGYDLVQRRTPPAAPTMPPPDAAPKLWVDRDPGVKATEFLREVYAPWIEAGELTGSMVKKCDKALYQAYHVRVHRYPNEAVALAEGNDRLDDAEAGRRHRAAVRASQAKAKARAASDNLSHPAL